MTAIDQHSAPSRIAALDILRGFALFGMILVHFHQAFRETVPDLKPWFGEGAMGWIVWWGVEQKAAATFAFLFGVGFSIVMRSAEAAERPLVPFYLRRLAALAVIGVVVEALTGYTILIHYAMWGVPLLLVRNWSSRSLLLLAVAAAMAFPLYRVGLGLYEYLTAAAEPARQAGAVAAKALTYQAEVLQRLEQMRRTYLGWRALIPSGFFALFLLGALAVRHRVIEQPRQNLGIIRTAMVLGAVSWLLYWLVLPTLPDHWFAWSRHAVFLRHGLGLIRDEWLAFTYMGALLLLLTARPHWVIRLAPVGSTGRMALTNYVLQAVLVYVLASRFGLGLALRPYAYVIGALLLFFTLLLLSRWWLSRFRYGPLEWIWRGVTYWRIPELSRQEPMVSRS